MLCAIWYHLCNLTNVKNTHGGVLLHMLIACNFTMIHTVYMYVLYENAMAASHPKLKSNFSKFRKSKILNKLLISFISKLEKLSSC